MASELGVQTIQHTNGTDALTIDASGNVALSQVGTGDFYREGTWTPVLGGSTSESGQAYSRQVGNYVRIGNLVFVQFDIIMTTKGTISGDAVIKGLPFQAHATDFKGRSGGSISYWNSLGNTYVYVAPRPEQGQNYAIVHTADSATASIATIAGSTVWNNGSHIMGMMTYITDDA
jgi:hypothetical protein